MCSDAHSITLIKVIIYLVSFEMSNESIDYNVVNSMLKEFDMEKTKIEIQY